MGSEINRQRGSVLHRHPLASEVALCAWEQHPLVGDLDFDHQPPRLPEGIGLGVVGRGGIDGEEVEDDIAAVGVVVEVVASDTHWQFARPLSCHRR